MSTAGPSSSGGLSAASHAAASHADAESLALMKRLQEDEIHQNLTELKKLRVANKIKIMFFKHLYGVFSETRKVKKQIKAKR